MFRAQREEVPLCFPDPPQAQQRAKQGGDHFRKETGERTMGEYLARIGNDDVFRGTVAALWDVLCVQTKVSVATTC